MSLCNRRISTVSHCFACASFHVFQASVRAIRNLHTSDALVKYSLEFFMFLTIGATGLCGVATAHPDAGVARREVMAAVKAMGGEPVLSSVHGIEFDAVGHRNMLEQSLRPDGPWWQDYFQLSEVRDFTARSERVDSQHRGYSSPDWWLRDSGWSTAPYYPTYVVADGAVATVAKGKYSRGSGAHLQDAEEDFAFGPVELLQTALAASDLHAEPDAQFHGFNHHVVAFTWNGYPVQVYLNSYTALPEMVQWTRPYPYDVFWNVWGDVTTRIVYGMWSLEPNGLRYPRQWSIERNGLPESDVTITSLTINPDIDPKALSMPAAVRQDFLAHKRTIADVPLGIPGQPAAEIEPGVIHIPGAWNVNLIRQPDGIVVLEGPISSAYTVKVLAEAQKRFPGLPVKAVITTSDSWPHIGGLREFVARGIPIYTLDLDKPMLQRLFNAPHTFLPDDLQKRPRAPKWRLFGGNTTLGSGPNRLELIPYRSETGERQTMVYFPQYKLLYTSDLFAPDQGKTWFTPEYLLELRNAVAREHLAVDNIFGMHYDVTPWKTVTVALDQFLATTAPKIAAKNPSSPLASAMQSLAFFEGHWQCAGKFVKSGKPISSTETFTTDLDGHWLAMRHDDQPPYPFHALELWGYDKDAKRFNGYFFDNFSGIRHFTSPGWEGNHLAWTDTASVHGTTDRFVFERNDIGNYQVTYAVSRNGKDWTAGDAFSCKRQ